MQMISFVLFGMVTAVFGLLYVCNKLIKNERKNVVVTNLILLISSYIFVIYADYRYAIVLAVITLSTWFFAKKEKFYWIGIIIPLLGLAYFKYTNFAISSIASIFNINFSSLKLLLPLGISFYSFSAISYIVDVKKCKTQSTDLLSVALYLSYFPKITSGPIQRSGEFFEKIKVKRNIGWDYFSCGIQIFMFGLFKKIVLADRLSVFVNQVYKTPQAFSSVTVLLAAIAYSLQIYFDFSGYSDMAVGISKILGIDLPRNFNLPYLAHNVTEFWKRWHITFSSWLQDYLYISLGGNRKGKIRTYINLVLTMVIGGLWHGANWTYIVWGLLHGLALAIHKMWMAITGSPQKEHNMFSNMLSIFITFIFTSFCWIFFRAENIDSALVIINRIFNFEAGVSQPYMWFFIAFVIVLVTSIVAATKSQELKSLRKKLNFSYVDGYYPLLNLNKFWGLVAFFVFCGLILCMAYTGGSPFVYGNY